MLFVALLLLWILFNGRFTIEVLIFGIFLSLALTYFTKKFLYVETKEITKHPIRNFILMVEYILILIWEIIKANILVFGVVLKKKLDFEPAIVRFKTNIKSKNLRVLLADSITLTPGTITVDLDDDGNYVVHCLDKSMGAGIDESVFVSMIRKMEED